MKLLITKKSKKPFPPPFENDGLTAIAIGLTINSFDPEHRKVYALENYSFVNCDKRIIKEDLENESNG